VRTPSSLGDRLKRQATPLVKYILAVLNVVGGCFAGIHSEYLLRWFSLVAGQIQVAYKHAERSKMSSHCGCNGPSFPPLLCKTL
jgi:hypothetical protein